MKTMITKEAKQSLKQISTLSDNEINSIFNLCKTYRLNDQPQRVCVNDLKDILNMKTGDNILFNLLSSKVPTTMEQDQTIIDLISNY